MSEVIEPVDVKQLWSIDGSPNERPWTGFGFEGRHAVHVEHVESQASQVTRYAARMFATETLAYADEDYLPYRRAYEAGQAFREACEQSRAKIDHCEIKRAHARALMNLADQLEMQRQRVMTAVDLQKGRLMVAFETQYAGTGQYFAAKVHEVTDDQVDGIWGNLQLTVKGKSEAVGPPADHLRRVPGLFIASQAQSDTIRS